MLCSCSQLKHLMEVSDQSQAPAALTRGERERERPGTYCGPQGRSGRFSERKIFVRAGSRTSDHGAAQFHHFVLWLFLMQLLQTCLVRTATVVVQLSSSSAAAAVCVYTAVALVVAWVGCFV